MRHIDLPHDEDTEDFDHDPECYVPCLATNEVVRSDCRCGDCCRYMILEALAEDAIVEPRIKECSPIYQDERLTASGTRELIGYLLNSPENGGACAFLERATNMCQIYETRPLMCRLFDCNKRDALVELGILPRKQ
jgi:Fe-S-cluster containining protein